MLQRHDDGAGVEAEDLRQVGRVRAPGLAGRGGALLEVGQEVTRPVDLDPRHEVAAQAGDPGDQLVSARDGVEGAGVHAAGAVDLEVGLGGLEQRVVLGPLHLPVRRVQGLPRRQGAKSASVSGTFCHMPPPAQKKLTLGAVMMPLLKSGPPPSWRM